MKRKHTKKNKFQDIDIISKIELVEIKGGMTNKAETKCGACCSLLGGGGSASKDIN